MAYVVNLTVRAERDLVLLFEAINAENSDAALRWYMGLKESILRLEEQPRRCPETPENARFRHLLYGHKPHIYRVIYRVAERAIDFLKDSGFRNTDISFLAAEDFLNKDFGYERDTKASEGTTTGAIAGHVVDGSFGWLAGIGVMAIPGVGPFIAAGPILGLLAGIGTGATIVGGIAGALIGIGIPEYEAKRYEGRIRGGEMFLSIYCRDSESARRARQTLEHTGAQEVSSIAENAGEKGSDYSLTDGIGLYRERH